MAGRADYRGEVAVQGVVDFAAEGERITMCELRERILEHYKQWGPKR